MAFCARTRLIKARYAGVAASAQCTSGGKPPVRNASETPPLATLRYRRMQNPPKDWPSKAHFESSPSSVFRTSSASATMESARKLARYFALASTSSAPKRRSRPAVDTRDDRPVPLWSSRSTLCDCTACAIHPPDSVNRAHSNPGPPWRNTSHGMDATASSFLSPARTSRAKISIDDSVMGGTSPAPGALKPWSRGTSKKWSVSLRPLTLKVSPILCGTADADVIVLTRKLMRPGFGRADFAVWERRVRVEYTRAPRRVVREVRRVLAAADNIHATSPPCGAGKYAY